MLLCSLYVVVVVRSRVYNLSCVPYIGQRIGSFVAVKWPKCMKALSIDLFNYPFEVRSD